MQPGPAFCFQGMAVTNIIMYKHGALACARLFFAALPPGLPAEIYRWVDENGQVHFEDRSKDQSESGVRRYTTPSSASDTPAQRMEKTRKLLNAYEAERQQAREQQEKQKELAEKRKRSCMTARDNLRQYQSYGGIYRLDKEGNRVYISDQERITLLEQSREKVAEYCD